MANELKDMKLTSVDLVSAGANREANISFFKSENGQPQADPQQAAPHSQTERGIFKRFLDWCSGAEDTQKTIEKSATTFAAINSTEENREKMWQYSRALSDSIFSIWNDKELDSAAKADLMRQSLSEFDTTMEGLISSIEANGQTTVAKQSTSDQTSESATEHQYVEIEEV